MPARSFVVLILSLAFIAPAIAEEEQEFDATARQNPSPVLTELDASIADSEWVTMIIKVENGDAKMFVPILRPLVRRNGHLVAHPLSNHLVMVESYGNVRRIVEIVRILDRATPKQRRQ